MFWFWHIHLFNSFLNLSRLHAVFFLLTRWYRQNSFLMLHFTKVSLWRRGLANVFLLPLLLNSLLNLRIRQLAFFLFNTFRTWLMQISLLVESTVSSSRVAFSILVYYFFMWFLLGIERVEMVYHITWLGVLSWYRMKEFDLTWREDMTTNKSKATHISILSIFRIWLF